MFARWLVEIRLFLLNFLFQNAPEMKEETRIEIIRQNIYKIKLEKKQHTQQMNDFDFWSMIETEMYM